MDFDMNALLLQIQDPATGLPVLLVAVLLNTLLGVIVAKKHDEFDRLYLMNFLENRVIYQLVPISALGIGAIYLHMPLLAWGYVTCAVVMAYDVVADIKEKLSELFPKK